MLFEDIESVLLTKDDIQKRVAEMGQEISRYYTEKNISEIVIIGVLTGAAVFTSDLIREITIPAVLDFIKVSSYGLGTVSSGEIRVVKKLEFDLKGCHVLIAEDIIDTGNTMNYLLEMCRKSGASSVLSCVLLDKPSRRKVSCEGDFVGFTIPDEFAVGYGLDYNEYYRQLPFIGILRKSVYENKQ